MDRLAALPGVKDAAVAFGLPFTTEFGASTSFTRGDEADSANAPVAGLRVVTPDYLRTMGIALRAGRTFEAGDDATGPEVAMINQEAARRFWPARNPIGDQIHVGVRLVRGERSGQKTVVGILGDVKYLGLDAAPVPEIYLPYAQHRVDSYAVVLRAAGDPLALAHDLRRVVAALDRTLPVADVQSMEALIGSSIAERRFTMLLLGLFAAVAVLLAAIGTYGLMAYVVGQRTREVGLRLALGASPRRVTRLFLGEGLRLGSFGLLCGLAAAAALTRTVTSFLFDVTATDPATYVLAGATLMGVLLLACCAPAVRAARVDPMVVLRME